MYINLKDFSHLRDNKTVQFKEEIVDGVSVTTICYMIANDELWDTNLGRECRGHAFDTLTGELLSLAFNKFFNLYEKQETQINNINWNDTFEVQTKKDGSLITFAIINDNVYAKTKKSFYSDVAILANQLAPESVKYLSKALLQHGLSPIWEFTHPEWKIVVDYGHEPTWTLLSIRDMGTGNYLNHTAMTLLVQTNKPIHDYSIVELQPYKTYEEIKESIDNMRDAEGYVIYFPKTNLRVKTKSLWYQNLHRVNTDLRVRDVAKMVVDETIDDIKELIIETKKDINKIVEIENNILKDYEYIIVEINKLKELSLKYSTRKEFAIENSPHKYFGQAIKDLDNRNWDWKEIWYKEFLTNYSLKTVYSDFNKVKEIL